MWCFPSSTGVYSDIHTIYLDSQISQANREPATATTVAGGGYSSSAWQKALETTNGTSWYSLRRSALNEHPCRVIFLASLRSVYPVHGSFKWKCETVSSTSRRKWSGLPEAKNLAIQQIIRRHCGHDNIYLHRGGQIKRKKNGGGSVYWQTLTRTKNHNISCEFNTNPPPPTRQSYKFSRVLRPTFPQHPAEMTSTSVQQPKFVIRPTPCWLL